jgi:hypothetical protein
MGRSARFYPSFIQPFEELTPFLNVSTLDLHRVDGYSSNVGPAGFHSANLASSLDAGSSA